MCNQKTVNRIVTRCTLETEDGVYSIEVPKYGLSMDDMVQDILKPLLLAAGYQPGTVEEYLGE
jgi:hypothetical protein